MKMDSKYIHEINGHYFERTSLATVQKTVYIDQVPKQEDKLWEMVVAMEVERNSVPVSISKIQPTQFTDGLEVQ